MTSNTPTAVTASTRKKQMQSAFNRLAPSRNDWMQRNAFYYNDDRRYMRFLVPQNAHVLELGCGTGSLLAALQPARGVGIDISPAMIDVAQASYPWLEFHVGDVEDHRALSVLGGPYDVIVLSDIVAYLDDIQRTLESLHSLCHERTRIVVAYYSQFWRPALSVASLLGQRMPQPPQNWLSAEDIDGLLELSGFQTIKREWRLLVPRHLGGIGSVMNRYIGTLPVMRRFSLRHYVVVRPVTGHLRPKPSATVVIPCRNEAGNIEDAVARMPAFCNDQQLLFVEGHSSDGTLGEIHRVIADHPDLTIDVIQQTGRGKGDAVRAGFAAATGDVLMILDADLTVPPEALPKFYDVVASGRADYVQGTRLVYPMDDRAMRFLNRLANHLFALLFTWLLNQRITDTLCGTKVLRKRDYERIEAQRSYFGDFDPFGDFDLIFGAAKLNLKMAELPIRYGERVYGTTQISRFRDGFMLLRMVLFAFRKLKAI